MAKQTITITVDSDVIEEIRQLKVNISGEINEFLRGLLARYNEDIEGINIKLERMTLDRTVKKLNHYQTIMRATESRIKKWEEMQQKKEEEKLKQEKEHIESTKKCINCGRIMEEGYKKHPFKKGDVCNSCFLSMSGKDYMRWNNND